MLTTVTSWLWIDIHRQIGVLYTAYTTIPNFFVLSHFFLCHPSNPWKTTGLSMSPVYIGVIYSSRTIDTHTYNHKHTHTHTHTQYSKHTQTNTYFRKIFEERGRVCVEQRTRSIFNPPPPPPPRLSPKIGQSIEHEEKYMANKRELSQFSIWRRDSSMLFLCEQQRTHTNGSTLNPDGGWTISTWSVSLPTILGGRDLCIWLPCKSWYKNCTLASIPKPLKFLRPHYPLLKVMYELARTIAKSTTHNQGQGGITRSRMSQPCYDRYDPYDEEN